MSVWDRARASLASFLSLPSEHSQDRYFRTIRQLLTPGIRWFDLGCGKQIVPDFAAPLPAQQELVSQVGLFVGADLDTATLRLHPLLHHGVLAWGDRLPFADQMFDLVTANMVVEHLEHPERVFSEAWRVLSTNGRFVFHTPNKYYPYIFIAALVPDFLKLKVIWFLERRREEDVFRTYYQANTVKDIVRLAAQCRFTVQDLSVGGSVGSLKRLGPLGVLEIPFLKLLSLRTWSQYNATIIVVLAKT